MIDPALIELPAGQAGEVAHRGYSLSEMILSVMARQ
jgi:hypothetical protein